MAIAKGSESTEAREFKRYTGVCPVFIKAVNPDKKKYEELFNTEIDTDPVFVETKEDTNGNSYMQAKIQIILEPDVEKTGIEMPLIPLTMFLQNRKYVGSKSGRTQIVDKYGRFAWATEEELANHDVPVYSNGPADIDKDYRPAYVGEEELMKFIKAYLVIPPVSVWDNNLRKMVPNKKVKPEECECRFDNLDKVFKGDFSEIKDALGFQPTNKVKVLLGVRTDMESGRLFNVVYNKGFIRNDSNNYSYLDKEIQSSINNAVANGRTVNTIYEVTPVHEYVVESTNFTPAPENPAPESNQSYSNETASDNDVPW